MQYRTLGRTGIKVSPYALGALALGTLDQAFTPALQDPALRRRPVSKRAAA